MGEVAGEERTAPGRIVVGVDGSESSKHALRWAARLAAADGSRVEAVTAWDHRSPSTRRWTSAGVLTWTPTPC
ncbi:hypothetical protein GCM10009721_14030 [Terrabacter tumescens]|uniref:UspA domain-containing protein n=1 Tax=Terrabacter tumescens TaxID=60443 RepID=A0ABQ2HTV3_9MICO|nr:universal stress protein [Terrabacter tumescens]GGM89885.1 hypothetical protein GCM10009721_14030 [Terrabacter tumescens]